jgi:hypothetical protein
MQNTATKVFHGDIHGHSSYNGLILQEAMNFTIQPYQKKKRQNTTIQSGMGNCLLLTKYNLSS